MILASGSHELTLDAVVWSVLLLLANAFFVAVEFSVLVARRTIIEPLAEGGGRRARAALAAMRDLNTQLAGAQLGITMASLGLGYVAEPAVSGGIESLLERFVDMPESAVRAIGFTLALAVVVFLHMLVGEMVPKNLAISSAERILLVLAIPNRLYTVLLKPVIVVLNTLAAAGSKLLKVEPTDELRTAHTAAEISVMLDESLDEGLLEEAEHRLMAGALLFSGRTAGDVMVPLSSVVKVARSASIQEIEDVIRTSGHNRIIVEDGPGRLAGFVHAKDLLVAGGDSPEARLDDAGVRVRSLPRVSASRPLDDVMLVMKRTRTHLAVVLDDGVPGGVVTLEDIVEAIVG